MNTTPNVSRGAARCLGLLHWYASRFERVFPRRDKLAKRLKVSPRTVDNYLRELKSCGFLEIRQEGPHPASYHMLSRENCEASAKLLRSFTDPLLLSYELSSNIQSERNRPVEEARPVENPPEKPSHDGKPIQTKTGDEEFRNEILEALKNACAMPTPKRPAMPEELCRAVRHASGDYR
jgi:DNA-binding transcriptional ArsR family regulator